MRTAIVAAAGIGCVFGLEHVPASADPCFVPGVREVETAARRHAGLDEIPRARGRARRSALLPDVSLRAARALDWDDRTTVPAPPMSVGHQLVFEARLTWRLDRLGFDPAEPRLYQAERATARARAALDEEVIGLYFRWRRAVRERDSDRAVDPMTADEAVARLDAATGGWLIDHLRCGP